ncbi:MAG: pyridoxamine kinase [Lachnospiraceae bacterium]
MDYKRILTIQDISCVGQCSLTVALPILSASGHETCVLPSAVLSTHTAFREGFTFRDLADDMPKIADHWKREGIAFDAMYTGYLGSAGQVDSVIEIMKNLRKPAFVSFVDPAMADNGQLYAGFDEAYVEEMKKLVFSADMILPNLTEGCLLTGMPYRERYGEPYIRQMLARLHAQGARTIVLTGVGYKESTTGVVVSDGLTNASYYYEHKRIERGCHGTGDVYASAFVGACLHGKSVWTAARIAADYTVRCIENTIGDPGHWYGVKFEPVLPYYIEALR